MTTLALDTSTPRPSLAVADANGSIVERNLGEVSGGGRRVLEAVHDILGEAEMGVADLTRIVVGVGPGGFTGIRIGIATALGLGQAADIEVVGASSLEALALGIAERRPDGRVFAPAIDARRREVFGAIYRPQGGRLATLVAPVAMPPVDFRRAAERAGVEGQVIIGGSGMLAYPEIFSGLGAALAPPGEHNFPRARHLIERVDAGAAVPARPLYCRLPDAEASLRRRREGGDS